MVLLSCSRYEKIDLFGAWLPNHSIATTFVFFPDSVWVLQRDSIKTFSYAIENRNLKLYGPNKLTGEKNVAKELYRIHSLLSDSLDLYHNFIEAEGLRLSYSRQPLQKEKFDRIEFSYSNGWQTNIKIEVNSLGNYTAWGQNFWTKKTYQASGVIKESGMTKVLWGVNYLYNLQSYNFSGPTCADCPSYGISMFKNNRIKSFYVSDAKKPQILNLITTTFLNIIDKSSKVKKGIEVPVFLSDTYLFKDTLVAEL